MSNASAAPRLPSSTFVQIYLRLLAVQSAFNYEVLIGNGIGFAMEPALRRLPGGTTGTPYREALARQSQYFNAHPYLAGVAVGALARAELEGVPATTIVRFRTALAGPLGSVGDRLVWVGWLPFCSLLALAAFGAGVRSRVVVLVFLVSYNIGHLGLRYWALREGWKGGLRVAGALAHPVLREGPEVIARAAALLAGVALPLAAARLIGEDGPAVGAVLAVALVVGGVLARLHGRAEGWRVAIVTLVVLVLFSVARHG